MADPNASQKELANAVQAVISVYQRILSIIRQLTKAPGVVEITIDELSSGVRFLKSA